MNERANAPRPRKLIRLDDQWPSEWEIGLPDDKMWASLKAHLPALSDGREAGLRRAIAKCVSRLMAQRSAIQQGAMLLASVREHQRFAATLRQAADIWKGIHGAPSYIRTQFDGLEAMAQEAERQAKTLGAKKSKTEPVGRPWQEFVQGVAQCWRDAGIDPSVNGRAYDELSNSPSEFQNFMAAFNANLPLLLKEPARNNQALAKKIMRAMKSSK